MGFKVEPDALPPRVFRYIQKGLMGHPLRFRTSTLNDEGFALSSGWVIMFNEGGAAARTQSVYSSLGLGPLPRQSQRVHPPTGRSPEGVGWMNDPWGRGDCG
jgi:hypothetical protein